MSDKCPTNVQQFSFAFEASGDSASASTPNDSSKAWTFMTHDRPTNVQQNSFAD
jgi:hypothetical protein